MLCLDIFWSLVILTLSTFMSLWARLFDQSSISNTGLALVSKESLAFVSSISNTLSTRVALEKARQSAPQWSISGSGGISDRQVSPVGMLIYIWISVFNSTAWLVSHFSRHSQKLSHVFCSLLTCSWWQWFWCFIWQERSTMTRVGCPVQHSLMEIRTLWRGCELSLCLVFCPGGMLELLAIIVRSNLEGGRWCGDWLRWSWMVLALLPKRFGGGSAVLGGGRWSVQDFSGWIGFLILRVSRVWFNGDFRTARIRVCVWGTCTHVAV
jgi:hypothetical protein